MKSKIHIVVGDAHARPGVPNDRFRWLGNLVVDTCVNHPDSEVVVIDMGDWEDMPSLSSYELGKKSYEGRRYRADIQAAIEARAEFRSPITRYNEKQKAGKRKQISPRLVSLGGNHFERRIERVVESSALLEGVISVEDGGHATYGWEYVPFLTPKEIDGISYVHYWQARGSSQPIGMGKYPAQVLIREKHCSTIVGHSHVWDLAISTDGTGKRLFAMVAGCYFDPEQHENYARQSNKDWTKCITILYDVVDGYPKGGFNLLPIETIKELYDY